MCESMCEDFLKVFEAEMLKLENPNHMVSFVLDSVKNLHQLEYCEFIPNFLNSYVNGSICTFENNPKASITLVAEVTNMIKTCLESINPSLGEKIATAHLKQAQFKLEYWKKKKNGEIPKE